MVAWHPLPAIKAEGRAAIKWVGGSADRLAALFLLEQVGDDVTASGEADLVAFDLRDEAARDVVVVFFVSDAAVGADQLDAVVLDLVDGADVDAVGADHFHMLANVLEAAHDLLLGWQGSTLRLRRRFTGVAPDYARLAHESSGRPGCEPCGRRLSRLSCLMSERPPPPTRSLRPMRRFHRPMSPFDARITGRLIGWCRRSISISILAQTRRGSERPSASSGTGRMTGH